MIDLEYWARLFAVVLVSVATLTVVWNSGYRSGMAASGYAADGLEACLQELEGAVETMWELAQP